jgi:hypothetical protein
VIFCIHGHPNILATHKNTIEFTKDSNLTRKGDCILGVEADFDVDELRGIVKEFSKVKIILKVGNLKEEIISSVNKDFNDGHEIVIRKSEYCSNRTLAIRADKAAADIDRRLVELLKTPVTGKIEVIGIR